MAVVAEIQAATSEQQLNIQLVAAYANVSDKISITSGPELSLRAKDGQSLSGLNTICRFLADISGRKAELLGIDEPQKAQISEWLSYRNTALAPITEDKLGTVNSHLLTRIYLVGETVTLADLCMFAALHRALVNLPQSQVQRFCNIYRWYDHLQNTVDESAIFPRLAFQKSPLPQPPALPAGKPATQGNKESATTKADPAKGITVLPPVHPEAPKTAVKAAADKPPVAPPAKGKAPEDAAKKAKKEARKEALKQAEAAKKQEEEVRIDMLDIRVGQITEVDDHPNADALYVEQIDLGDGKPRQVVSGLRKFVPKDQMQGRRVVVCTNLKPAKMREVTSYGMVLCASTKAHDKVDPLTPPPTAKLGERIMVSGYENEALAEVNPKKKIVEKLKDDLLTDSIGVATYKSIPFMCSTGPVTSTLPNGFVG